MARLFLAIALLAILAIAGLALLGTVQAVALWAKGKEEDQMPQTFKRISYIVLVILMFGITSGMLGAS
ncbi:hypothetical protein [Yoonia maritima]|uniref:hypothetical protein n=1 Tax=Yoonia maritima TaxID=1435347 RepID=UPI000D0E7E73|nr:hypothetical protein [Yoonia maritima]